eukprot:99545-Chlamydomonas_euryale.AAC.1
MRAHGEWQEEAAQLVARPRLDAQPRLVQTKRVGPDARLGRGRRGRLCVAPAAAAALVRWRRRRQWLRRLVQQADRELAVRREWVGDLELKLLHVIQWALHLDSLERRARVDLALQKEHERRGRRAAAVALGLQHRTARDCLAGRG